MSGIYKIFTIFLTLTLIINSCQLEQEFEYNDKFQASRLVINAFLNEHGIHTEIRKTLSPLDIYSSDSVSEVIISLYENGIYLFDLLKKDTYIYVSPGTFIPQRDKAYYLTVQAQNFETLQSSSICLPFKVSIVSCKYKGYNNYTTVYIKFEDPAPAGNAYYIGYKLYLNNEEYSNNYFIDPFGVFNDNSFNNEVYTTEKDLNIRIYNYNYENGTDTTYKADSARIFLYSLSPDFKLFLESFVAYDLSNRSPVYEQPFQVFTNIKNGYGIFGSYCIDNCTLIFDKDSI